MRSPDLAEGQFFFTREQIVDGPDAEGNELCSLFAADKQFRVRWYAPFLTRFRFSFCRTRVRFATSWRWTISLKAAPLWLRCPIVTVFYSRSFRQSGKWK